MRLAQCLVLGLVLAACGFANGGGTGGGSGGGTGGGSGGGTQNCVWLGSCVGSCTANDTACLNTCSAQATPSAISTWNTYATCTNTYNCQDAACIDTNCAAEHSRCQADLGTGGGAGGGAGLTTSGSCRIDTSNPVAAPQSYCWDYVLTAAATTNDGTVDYYYFDGVSVANGQTDCANANNRTSTVLVSAFDPATVSASNQASQQQACSNANQPPYVVATWSDSPCVTTGAIGYCTWTVTNTWDSSASTVTSLTTTTWILP